MLIALSGLPGTGKSELAQGIGRRLRVPVLSVDPVESAIVRAGIAQGFETGLAAYLVVEAIADSQLALGQDAIVDAVNAEEPGKAMWRALAIKHGVALKIIECHCSDEALHRARLAARQGHVADFLAPTWEDVQRRRLAYTSWGESLHLIDSVESQESNLDRVLVWLKRSGEGRTA